MLLHATMRPSLAALQPKRWSDEEEAELVRLVKLHGRGSWALIEKEGADMFQGRRKQVGHGMAPPRAGAGAGAACAATSPLGCVMSGAASGHMCRQHPLYVAAVELVPSFKPPGPAGASALQVDLKDKWRNIVRAGKINEREEAEIEVGTAALACSARQPG